MAEKGNWLLFLVFLYTDMQKEINKSISEGHFK